MLDKVTIVGKTVKPEGVKGFIKLEIEEGFEKSIIKSPFLFIYLDGLPVPFKIEEVLSDKNISVKLEDINTPEQASSLARLPVGLHEKNLLKTRKFSAGGPEKLQNYTIFDKDVRVGQVLEIARFPAQVMAIIVTESEKVIHIPLVEDWIHRLDHEKQEMYMGLPEGLLDI